MLFKIKMERKLNNARGFKIFRKPDQLDDSLDSFEWQPLKESDELYEALKATFPKGTTHRSRMRDAFDFSLSVADPICTDWWNDGIEPTGLTQGAVAGSAFHAVAQQSLDLDFDFDSLGHDIDPLWRPPELPVIHPSNVAQDVEYSLEIQFYEAPRLTHSDSSRMISKAFMSHASYDSAMEGELLETVPQALASESRIYPVEEIPPLTAKDLTPIQPQASGTYLKKPRMRKAANPGRNHSKHLNGTSCVPLPPSDYLGAGRGAKSAEPVKEQTTGQGNSFSIIAQPGLHTKEDMDRVEDVALLKHVEESNVLLEGMAKWVGNSSRDMVPLKYSASWRIREILQDPVFCRSFSKKSRPPPPPPKPERLWSSRSPQPQAAQAGPWQPIPRSDSSVFEIPDCPIPEILCDMDEKILSGLDRMTIHGHN